MGLESEYPEMLYCIRLRFLRSFQIYMCTFFRFDQGKVCILKCKVKASGQEIGLELDSESITSNLKQVLAGISNPSFNKSYI